LEAGALDVCIIFGHRTVCSLPCIMGSLEVCCFELSREDMGRCCVLADGQRVLSGSVRRCAGFRLHRLSAGLVCWVSA